MIVTVVTYVLGVLSVAAGVPKLLQMPQELAFLSSIGLKGAAVSILGIAQLVGGILLFPSKLRLIGIGLASLVFLISSAAILVGGNVAFGLISLLPVLACMAVAYSLLGEMRDVA